MAYSSDWTGQDWRAFHQQRRQAVSQFFAGFDDDVRNLFLNLPASQLQRVLANYEEAFGRGARQYAQRVYKKWKSGEVMMSGDVSVRLLLLLPPLLSFEQKFALVTKLWEKTQPKRILKLIVTPGTDFEGLRQKIWTAVVRQHGSCIPDRIKRVLAWLTEDDVIAAEALTKEISLRRNRMLLDILRVELLRVLDNAELASGLRFVGVKTLYVGQLTIKIRCSRHNSIGATLWKITPW